MGPEELPLPLGAASDEPNRNDIEPRFIPLPRTASTGNSTPSAGGLSRSGSGASRSAALGSGVAATHTPRSQTTFGHRIKGESVSITYTSNTPHSTPQTGSSTHASGVQPGASFFHPQRPNYYSGTSNYTFGSSIATRGNQSSKYSALPAHTVGNPLDAGPIASAIDQRPSSTGSDSFAQGSFTTEDFGMAGRHGTVTSNTTMGARSFATKVSREPLLPIGQRPKPSPLLHPHLGGSAPGRSRSNTSTQARKSNASGSGSAVSGTTGGRVRTSLEKFLRRTLSVDAHSPSMSFARSPKEVSSLEDLEASGREFNDSYVELKNQPAVDEEVTFNITNDNNSNRSPSTTRRRRLSPLPHSPSTQQQHGRFPQFDPVPPSSKDPSVLPLVNTPILSDTGKPMRNYELHPSQNRFFLGGKLLTGGDSALPFIGSLFLALALAGTWAGTTAVWWWENETLAVPIVGAYMCILTICNMLMTAFSDPGILPRDLDLDPPYPNTTSSDDGTRAPLPRELKVRNIMVRVKYCQTCRIYRPPRSSHCRMCDNCVDGCDHHCQWVNNCVGRRNYTSFIVFLTSATLSLCLFICTSALHLVLQARQDDISAGASLRKGAGSAVLFAISAIVVWPVAGLLGYHVRLLLLNLTTIEQIRATAHKSLTNGPAPQNPFALGSWRRNVGEMLCRPQGTSWLNASGLATEDKREANPDAEWEESEMETNARKA